MTCYKARMTVVSMMMERVDRNVKRMFRMENMNKSLIFANVISDSVFTEAYKEEF